MKVGSICYATQQGLGYLMKHFYDGGVITDPAILSYSAGGKRPMHPEWYPDGTPVIGGRNGVINHCKNADVDAMIFFETPFNWDAFDVLRERGVKSVLMPMYEWMPANWNERSKPDAMFCPSSLDVEYFENGFPEGCCPHTPVPVSDDITWTRRIHANKFLHNAGNVGCGEHKGTRELLQATKYVKNPEFRLTVRAQDTRELRKIVDATNPDDRVTIQYGEIPYTELWKGHDVYIAPEKYNGLSLPLQEAFASGLMVMTTNRNPHNTWLPGDPLIPVESYKQGGYRGCVGLEEAIVNPEALAAHIDKWVGHEIERYSCLGGNYLLTRQWNAMRTFYHDCFRALVEDRPCPSF